MRPSDEQPGISDTVQDNNVWPFIDNQDSGEKDPHGRYLFFHAVKEWCQLFPYAQKKDYNGLSRECVLSL